MQKILKRRKEQAISQRQLANILGIDRSTVAKWETGKALPRAEMLVKLAAVLQCTVDELLNAENK